MSIQKSQWSLFELLQAVAGKSPGARVGNKTGEGTYLDNVPSGKNENKMKLVFDKLGKVPGG